MARAVLDHQIRCVAGNAGWQFIARIGGFYGLETWPSPNELMLIQQRFEFGAEVHE
ncbi:hypothetical protein D3C76_1639170 [compost metagenome]